MTELNGDAWPAGWTIATLDELALLVTSGSRDWKPYYNKGTGVFVLTQNVRMGRLEFSTLFNVDPPPDDPARVRSLIEENDLLVNIVGEVGLVARVRDSLPEHYVCQSVALVRPAIPEMSGFLEFYLSAPGGGQAYFQQKTYGMGRPHLSFADIKAMPIPVPPLEQQAAIVAAVERYRTAAEELMREIQLARSQVTIFERAVFSKALSGRIAASSDGDATELLERAKVAKVDFKKQRDAARKKTRANT